MKLLSRWTAWLSLFSYPATLLTILFYSTLLTAYDIPILMYHHVTNKKRGRYYVTPDELRSHLEKLYNAGYVTIPVRDMLEKKPYLKKQKAVILRFDGAKLNQFRYIKDKKGKLQIDPDCAVAILLEFYEKHPEFGKNAFFCILPQGFEQPEYTAKKLNFLLDQGMELCTHGTKHIDLTKGTVADVDKEFGTAMHHWQKVLGKRAREIDMLATPFGAVPKNEEARKRLQAYGYKGKIFPQKAVFYAGWGYNRVAPDPWSAEFDPYALPSIEVTVENFDKILASTNKNARTVSDRAVHDRMVKEKKK